jgi:hypothetical protein
MGVLHQMSDLFNQGKEQVTKLCQYFTINRQAFLAPGVKEAHVRQSLIDPFFEALGWDVGNKRMIAPQYREVIPEDSLDIEGHQKAPDYTFRVGSLPKFYAEAKKCGANIGADPSPAFQLRRYGWSAKLALSILTDFEELGVYDCTLRPRPNEKASHARIQYLHFEEYPDRWRELWDVFSREAVWSGAFDQYAASKRKRGTSEVDVEFLKEMEGWRLSLAGNIALRNKGLSLDDLNAVVQLTIDRVVFLRMAEDRGLEPYEQLLKLCERPDVYPRFIHDLSHRADQKYNSGLFHFQKESGVSEDPDRITPKLAVDDKIFKPILQSLYFAHGSPYQFGVMPVEILGTVYERFLGKVIRLTAGHHAKIEEKPEVRKAGGVYYTPAYIVEYIVKNTIARQIKERNPAQLAGSKDKPPFRVMDMACGSGSFLLGAYRCLLDHCFNWYVEHRPENYKKAVYKDARDGHWRLTIEEKKRILTTHIFGVDIDRQAVEVTKLSLLLKVLEGETDQSLSLSQLAFGDRALPNLADNIKCGNSLIGSDYFTDKMFPEHEEIKQINPFDWEKRFPAVIKAGGFDCIIGNPPYVRPHNLSANLKEYLWPHYRTFTHKSDLYCCFIENGTRILKTGGLFSYIVSHGWLRLNSFQKLRRFVLDNYRVLQLVELPYNVFADAQVSTGIFVFAKAIPSKKDKISIIRAAQLGDTASFAPVREIPQAAFRQTFQNVFDTSISPETESIKDKMRSGVPIGDRFEICFGLKTGDDDKFLHHTKGLHPQDKPLLRGDDVKRYGTNYKGEYVWYVPKRMTDNRSTARPGEPGRFEQPKLLVKDTSADFACTYEPGRYYVKDVLIVIPKSDVLPGYDLRFVAGIINSMALRFYYRTTFQTIHVQNEELASLPLPQLDLSEKAAKSKQEMVIRHVDAMLELHERLAATKSAAHRAIIERQIEATDAEIDRLVYELYGLTAEEIALIENSVSLKSSKAEKR